MCNHSPIYLAKSLQPKLTCEKILHRQFVAEKYYFRYAFVLTWKKSRWSVLKFWGQTFWARYSLYPRLSTLMSINVTLGCQSNLMHISIIDSNRYWLWSSMQEMEIRYFSLDHRQRAGIFHITELIRAWVLQKFKQFPLTMIDYCLCTISLFSLNVNWSTVAVFVLTTNMNGLLFCCLAFIISWSDKAHCNAGRYISRLKEWADISWIARFRELFSS